MDIQITGRNVSLDPERRAHVERRLQYAIGRFDKRIAQVLVRLADLNGPRGGVDQHCRITVQFRPRGEIIIEECSADIDSAVSLAANRAGHAVRRELERRRTARLRRASRAA
jgi:putative sigma-54 modulation protein